MIGLDLGNLLVHLKADTIQYDRQLKKAITTMRIVSRRIIGIARGMALRLGSMFNRFGHFIGRWAKRLGIALVAVGVMSIKAFASFDDAMIKSLAIMGDVSEGMQKQMRDLAMTLSIEGVTSATDLAKSYFFLASAGLTAEQSLTALATVEAFAVAGAFDMAEATDLLTDAQSALGKTVDNATENMKNMVKISDVLVGANTLANASTRQFSLALTTQAGSAMKVFNVQLEQGVAVLAAYADQGIKAQRAGTMFSRMLRLMTKGFRENEPVWKKLKINIFDSAGELLDMSEIIGQLSNALGDMSVRQKVAALDMLGFQARSQQTILPLLGLGERIEEYTRKLEKMRGITKEVHEKQLRSFSSQMKILWNNIKSVAIAIGEKLAPELLKFSTWFRTNRDTIEEWSTKFVDGLIGIKDNLFDLIAFMRQDFHKGLKLALDISLELFIGFGKAIVAIIKTAAVQAADAFVKIFGEKIGLWLIKESGIMGQSMWETFRDFPLTGALRGEMLKMGVALAEGAEKPPIITNLKGDLKTIIKDTKEAIELLKKLSGIGVITEESERKKRERDLLKRLKTTPIGKAVGGEAGIFGLSIAERRIANMEKRITESIQRIKDKAAKLMEKLPFVGGGFVLKPTAESERAFAKIERLAERHYKKLAEMKKRLLGGTDETLMGMKDNFAEMMALIQGGSFERFQVVRTALVDPRSENVTMIDLSRQQLMESKRQTEILRSIDSDEGG